MIENCSLGRNLGMRHTGFLRFYMQGAYDISRIDIYDAIMIDKDYDSKKKIFSRWPSEIDQIWRFFNKFWPFWP